MLERFFTPDFMLRSFRELSPSFMECTEKTTLIADIDGAVASPEDTAPSRLLSGWVEAHRRRGISVALISGSDPRRLRRFSELLRLPAFYAAGGSKSSAMLRAIKKLGTNPGSTVALCSRLVSDVPAARRAGITAVSVRAVGGSTKRSVPERMAERYYRRVYEERKNHVFPDEEYDI